MLKTTLPLRNLSTQKDFEMGSKSVSIKHKRWTVDKTRTRYRIRTTDYVGKNCAYSVIGSRLKQDQKIAKYHNT